MDWIQVVTIIGTTVGVNIALIATLATLIIWTIGKVDSDVKSVSNQITGISTRLDGHAQRIDQIYSVIVQMLKEKK